MTETCDDLAVSTGGGRPMDEISAIFSMLLSIEND
jgi:hypothetical protein